MRLHSRSILVLAGLSTVAAWTPQIRQDARAFLCMTAKDDQQLTDNILEDGQGHINRDLAERIWNWEQDRRKAEDLPKLDYSVRAGLRLVDSMVEEMSSSDSSSDLVQEGLTALLDAMSHYRKNEDEDFETYARDHIRQRLDSTMDEDVRHPLPMAVKSVVQQAKRLMNESKGASLVTIAEELNLPVERLQVYLRLAQHTGMLSVESTVEILNPLLEDSTPAYRDQEDWELQQGKLLDDGKSVRRDELVDEYLDEMIEHEGDDEAWVQSEQIAGPLGSLIPDMSEPSPDDMILQELIRHDVSSFLDSSLDAKEVSVIRCIFGLDSGRPRSATETSKELGIEAHKVSNVLAGALEKLRKSYLSKFIDDEDEDEEDIVDSV